MRVVWTGPAYSDLESIREHIARDSEHYAARYVGKILEAVEALQRFPQMGEVVLNVDGNEIRQLVFQSHRILYQVQGKQVVVLTVVHAARDPGSLAPKPWGHS